MKNRLFQSLGAALVLLAPHLHGQAIQVIGTNVGIGTTNPQQKLQLGTAQYLGIPSAGGSYIPLGWDRGNSGGIILAGSSNSDGSGWSYGSRIVNHDYGDGLALSFDTLYAGTWTNDALTISGRSGRMGYVGIGTVSPSYKLEVNGDAGVAPNQHVIARYASNETYKASLGWNHLQLGNNGTNYIIAGRTAAGAGLEFWTNNTSDYRYGSQGPNGVKALSLSSSGDATISGRIESTGSYNGYSGALNLTDYAPSMTFNDIDNNISWMLHCNGDNLLVYRGSGFKTGGWTGPYFYVSTAGAFAPIWYDRDNTGYYVKASGNSRLNEISLNAINSPFPGNDSGYYGDRPYQWGYQEGGPWTYPYPDLIIGYHTGLKFGAHYSYGGTRFYSDHPSRTTDMIFSVGDGDGHVRVTNSLYVGSSVQAANFRSTSSQRWKENIESMKNALDTVRALRGVTYQWKAGTAQAGQKDIGFIAEEVDKVVPQVVGHDAEGKAASVDYGRLTAVLAEAVKDLDKNNSVTTAEVTDLRKEIARLEEQSARSANDKFYYLAGLVLVMFVGIFVGRKTRGTELS